jgi:hypothetical protein
MSTGRKFPIGACLFAFVLMLLVTCAGCSLCGIRSSLAPAPHVHHCQAIWYEDGQAKTCLDREQVRKLQEESK